MPALLRVFARVGGAGTHRWFRALLGLAIIGLPPALLAATPAPVLGEREPAGASSGRADAPPPEVVPSLRGNFRTRVHVTSGGKPFGQHRGDSATRRYRFREDCGQAQPCNRVRLVRSGRRGKFGSELKRRGRAFWHGVEKVHGRCDNGLDFHSRTTIVVRAKSYRGNVVSEFAGRLRSRVHGCVKGSEHASIRGRLR